MIVRWVAKLKIRHGPVEAQVERAGRAEDGGELNEHTQGIAARNVGGEPYVQHGKSTAEGIAEQRNMNVEGELS